MKKSALFIGLSVAILWLFGLLLLVSPPQAVMGEVKAPFSAAENVLVAPIKGQLAVLSWRTEEYYSVQFGTSYKAQDVSGWLFNPRSLKFIKATSLQSTAELIARELSFSPQQIKQGRTPRLISTGDKLVLMGAGLFKPVAYLVDPGQGAVQEIMLGYFGESRASTSSVRRSPLLFDDVISTGKNTLALLYSTVVTKTPWLDQRSEARASQLISLDLDKALPSDQLLPEPEVVEDILAFQDVAGSERLSSPVLVMGNRKMFKIASDKLLVVGTTEAVKGTGGSFIPAGSFAVFDFEHKKFSKAGSFGASDLSLPTSGLTGLGFVYLGEGKLLAGSQVFQENLPLFIADIEKGTLRYIPATPIDLEASALLPDRSRKWNRKLNYLKAGSSAFITIDNFRELPDLIFKVTRSGKVTSASPHFIGGKPDFDRSSLDEAPNKVLATAQAGNSLFFFGKDRVVFYRYSIWPSLLGILLLAGGFILLLITLTVLFYKKRRRPVLTQTSSISNFKPAP